MTDMLVLKCPSCGGKGHMIEGTNRFHCDYCGTESLIQLTFQQMQAPAVEPERKEEVIRPKTPIPTTVRTEHDEQSSRIIQRWFSPKYIFLAFFCVVWDGFLCFWYSMVLGSFGLSSMSGSGFGGFPIVMALFPMLHLAVGVYLTYTTLAGFLNRTTVELTRDTLATYYDPLPWPGEKKIAIADVKQLYCKEVRKTGKHGSVSYTYDLYVVTKDHRQVQLLSGLDTPDLARYFEQQLESWMRIKDQPVLGEVR